MEQWKLGVIIVLLGGLVGYGIFQSQPRQQVPIEPPPITPQPEPAMNLVGQPAPAWNISKEHWANTPEPITLEKLKGEVVLIEFWRVDCSHCQEAAPFMENLYKKYSTQGLKIVTFHSPSIGSGPDSREGNWENVQKTMKEWGITYPVAFDKDAVVFKEYKGNRYPTAILLNRNGIVEYYNTGHTPEKEKSLLVAIEAMLKGQSVPPAATVAETPESSPLP